MHSAHLVTVLSVDCLYDFKRPFTSLVVLEPNIDYHHIIIIIIIVVAVVVTALHFTSLCFSKCYTMAEWSDHQTRVTLTKNSYNRGSLLPHRRGLKT